MQFDLAAGALQSITSTAAARLVAIVCVGVMGFAIQRGATCTALYVGASIGGLTAGRWQSMRVSGWQVLRCFAGGVVMAWGSLLIPGSNDGLILIGLPLLRPYAWLAFASMFGAIAAAMLFQGYVRRQAARDPRRS